MPQHTNATDQILNLLDKSQKILLLTHAKADCDGLGSMISMYLTLKELGKTVIAATNDPAPDNLSFLPSINIVQNSLKSVEDFIISLDVSQTPLKKIRYNLEGNQVNIIVSPKAGQFNKKDVRFLSPEGKDEEFDLIITFDTGNLEHLGPLYDNNANLFFKTPLINIDHHASNTDFGQVNMVDVVAASTTEVMLKLLKKMERRHDKKFITDDIATLLLAGLITDTGSFQHANTSPSAMESAAELLDLGARQQEIIKNIYKTKPLSMLKLWGTVLSKVESDPVYRMVWSTITKQDLEETGATSEAAEGIIDDLLSNAPGAEIILLMKWHEEDYVSVSMRSTTNSADVGKIAAEMGGGGHVRAAGFKVRDGKSLDKVAQMTLKKVKEYQGTRLNIHPDTVHKPMNESSDKKPTKFLSNPLKKDSSDKKEKENSNQTKYLEFDKLDATDESFLKEKDEEEKETKGNDTKKRQEEVKKDRDEENHGEFEEKEKSGKRKRRRNRKGKKSDESKEVNSENINGNEAEPKKEEKETKVVVKNAPEEPKKDLDTKATSSPTLAAPKPNLTNFGAAAARPPMMRRPMAPFRKPTVPRPPAAAMATKPAPAPQTPVAPTPAPQSPVPIAPVQPAVPVAPAVPHPAPPVSPQTPVTPAPAPQTPPPPNPAA